MSVINTVKTHDPSTADGAALPGVPPLGPGDIAALKYKRVKTRDDLIQLEQRNIERGLIWLKRRGAATEILNAAFFKELHRRLFGKVWRRAGKIRKTEQHAGIDPDQITAQLEALLDHARFWADNGAYPPLEAAARFHHRLMQIQCFDIGNERHARIATDVFLHEIFDCPPINWAREFNLMNDHDSRDQYIAALKAADIGNISQLLKFMRASDDTPVN